MQSNIAQQLLELNREFYQTFADHFSTTRGRIQPGVRSVIQRLPSDTTILDLGCGNGELARELPRTGWHGKYIGLDFSPGLLENCLAYNASSVDKNEPSCCFFQADLTSPDWHQVLKGQTGFQYIFAFAVLHHIPSEALRMQLLDQVRSLIHPDGFFVHSNWQFLNSPRLVERIQEWPLVGLTLDDIDPGDYLLDWRSGGTGLRYVHHFDQDELAYLAKESGFLVSENFYSDGATGNLGYYQFWQLR